MYGTAFLVIDIHLLSPFCPQATISCICRWRPCFLILLTDYNIINWTIFVLTVMLCVWYGIPSTMLVPVFLCFLCMSKSFSSVFESLLNHDLLADAGKKTKMLICITFCLFMDKVALLCFVHP